MLITWAREEDIKRKPDELYLTQKETVLLLIKPSPFGII